MAQFNIRIDAVSELAKALEGFDSSSLGRATLEAVNATTNEAFDLALGEMNRNINLSDAYLKAKMSVQLGTDPVRPIASIIAAGKSSNIISYSPRQISKVVNWTNAQIQSGSIGKNPRKPGSLLPWKKRVGNPALAIPTDRKQAGLVVLVSRDKGKAWQHSFVLTNAAGFKFVASRAAGDHHGKGKVHAKTGPSVYQLFRHTIEQTEFIERIKVRLSSSIVSAASIELKKVLG